MNAADSLTSKLPEKQVVWGNTVLDQLLAAYIVKIENILEHV